MSLTIVAALKNQRGEARLDAEILLAHVLNVPRTYLHTWPEKMLSLQDEERYKALLAQRQQGVPIAYLTGHREFWSLDFIVNPAVLIPRHETELLVEMVLKNLPSEEACIADLGTGSGAIALAIAKERPHWQIHAVELHEEALKVARLNAEHLGVLNVVFHQGVWCKALPPLLFQAIVSNPPYLGVDDSHLLQGDVRFEPHSALVATEKGLGDFRQIISEAKNHLIPGGRVFFEHGFDQAENIANLFQKEGYNSINMQQDLAGLNRVIIATWPGF